MNRIAFIFPGQGAQHVGMGKDFANQHSIAKQTFEEADELLQENLSKLIFSGSESDLKMTRICQPAIFVVSMAIVRVMQNLFGELKPAVCAGLSLGEYSALVASGHLSFEETLLIVKGRAEAMHEACENTRGTMAVVLGLDPAEVGKVVSEELWLANFNTPGQVVISGTIKGVEAGAKALKAQGAKVLPLKVHGAFHSGLMQGAEDKLAVLLKKAPLTEGKAKMVMNVTGDFVSDLEEIRKNLISQVTHPVYWQKEIEAMEVFGVDLFVELGPGKTLAGMNKKIGTKASTVSVQGTDDIAFFVELFARDS